MRLRSLTPLVALLLLPACKKDPVAPPTGPAAIKPRDTTPLAPLEPLRPDTAPSDAGEDDPLYRITPLPPTGPAAPAGATRVTLDGEQATVNGAPFDPAAGTGPVLLVPTEDTYLSQAAGLLARLDDAHRELWLQHPDGPFAFKVTLRDNGHFQAWLDDPVPGKVRIIHRADGYELQTNMGKLPGGDPNGPTVPVRGGKFDLSTLQRGLVRLKSRFKDAPDLCVVPSYGMELGQVARALGANFLAPDQPVFGEAALVYPRPGVDAGTR